MVCVWLRLTDRKPQSDADLRHSACVGQNLP